MTINNNELTSEMIQKAMNCETAEELMELAREEGIELTKEEAEAYLAELEDFELDEATLSKVAGGDGILPYCTELFKFKKAPEGCTNLEATR